MPTKAGRPCVKRGCPAITSNRYCPTHAEHVRDDDKWRGSSASRGYDGAWRKVRLLALRRDKYLCIACLAAGRITAAIDVDHIIPIWVDATLRLVLGNLQSLCRACHRAKTAEDHK